jgi:hypothetical protein
MASATVMSRLVPSAAFGLAAVPARPPTSPEARAVHLLAKCPVAKSKATTDQQQPREEFQISPTHKTVYLLKHDSDHEAIAISRV